VIDPEDEYARLAQAAGGTLIRPGAAGVRLNPLDLPAPPDGAAAAPDGLLRRALFLHTFLAVLLGEQPDGAGRAVLDQAIMACYQAAGITADPRTWARPAPLLADLADTLTGAGAPGPELAARLHPWTRGTHSGLFAGPTTTRPAGHLVVWSLRDLPEELKTAGMLLVLDAIWQQVTSGGPPRRRLVVVDEAWLLMRQADGAAFLYRMAKAARKHWAALAVITQDAEDVLGSQLGRAVVANAATQILLRQAQQAITLVTDAFGLSAGEREFLLAARRGEGLLLAGPDGRVAFQAIASDAEHQLATTTPAGPPAPASPGKASPGDLAESPGRAGYFGDEEPERSTS
jgi:type IV secretory pathway VirB4 component